MGASESTLEDSTEGSTTQDKPLWTWKFRPPWDEVQSSSSVDASPSSARDIRQRTTWSDAQTYSSRDSTSSSPDGDTSSPDGSPKNMLSVIPVKPMVLLKEEAKMNLQPPDLSPVIETPTPSASGKLKRRKHRNRTAPSWSIEASRGRLHEQKFSSDSSEIGRKSFSSDNESGRERTSLEGDFGRKPNRTRPQRDKFMSDPGQHTLSEGLSDPESLTIAVNYTQHETVACKTTVPIKDPSGTTIMRNLEDITLYMEKGNCHDAVLLVDRSLEDWQDVPSQQQLVSALQDRNGEAAQAKSPLSKALMEDFKEKQGSSEFQGSKLLYRRLNQRSGGSAPGSFERSILRSASID